MHDFDAQKTESAETFTALERQFGPFRAQITLDLHFMAIDLRADPQGCADALLAEGYVVDLFEGMIEASIDVDEVNAEAIWGHEERTTKIALKYGMSPDGWGFAVPRSPSIFSRIRSAFH